MLEKVSASMLSGILEPKTLISIGTRTAYQATGGAVQTHCYQHNIKIYIHTWYTQGSPSGCGWHEIRGVSQV